MCFLIHGAAKLGKWRVERKEGAQIWKYCDFEPEIAVLAAVGE